MTIKPRIVTVKLKLVLGCEVNQYRDSKGLSQEDLADAMNLYNSNQPFRVRNVRDCEQMSVVTDQEFVRCFLEVNKRHG